MDPLTILIGLGLIGLVGRALKPLERKFERVDHHNHAAAQLGGMALANIMVTSTPQGVLHVPGADAILRASGCVCEACNQTMITP